MSNERSAGTSEFHEEFSLLKKFPKSSRNILKDLLEKFLKISWKNSRETSGKNLGDLLEEFRGNFQENDRENSDELVLEFSRKFCWDSEELLQEFPWNTLLNSQENAERIFGIFFFMKLWRNPGGILMDIWEKLPGKFWRNFRGIRGIIRGEHVSEFLGISWKNS